MGGARQVLVNLASCCRILRVQRQLFASGFFPLRKSALLCERRDGVYRCCIEVAKRRHAFRGRVRKRLLKGFRCLSFELPVPFAALTGSSGGSWTCQQKACVGSSNQASTTPSHARTLRVHRSTNPQRGDCQSAIPVKHTVLALEASWTRLVS